MVIFCVSLAYRLLRFFQKAYYILRGLDWKLWIYEIREKFYNTVGDPKTIVGKWLLAAYLSLIFKWELVWGRVEKAASFSP